jgi:HD-GYP domain-containing protein (c-di-GMP phosphodiesterase class II)
LVKFSDILKNAGGAPEPPKKPTPDTASAVSGNEAKPPVSGNAPKAPGWPPPPKTAEPRDAEVLAAPAPKRDEVPAAPSPKRNEVPAPAKQTGFPPLPPPEDDATVRARVEALPSVDATAVYGELVDAARRIYAAAAAPADHGPQALPQETLFKLVRLVRTGDPSILLLADRAAPDNYLYGHAANVTVLSLRLGLACGASEEALYTLALGALLHDIGMAPDRATDKPGPLTDAERAALQKHPRRGQELLTIFPGLVEPRLEAVRRIVGQVHERAKGDGYPEKLPSAGVDPLAKVVGVCDVYEALTHDRAWRPRLLPHDALARLIEEHEASFDAGLIKQLIETLSLFPPGSYVRLSTGDVARVLEPNPGLPTRPKVRVALDSQGRRPAAAAVLNLATQPLVYIAEVVDETRLPAADARLAAELRAQRWWVKGL